MTDDMPEPPAARNTDSQGVDILTFGCRLNTYESEVLFLIHISELTRQAETTCAVFCSIQ